MWIFLNDSSLSIVADRNNDRNLFVRGRAAGDIEKSFPDADVQYTPQFDYAYRASIPRGDVAAMIAQLVVQIDYDNFKSSISHDELPRHDAYLNMWAIMREFQQQQERAHIPRRLRKNNPDA
jgi:hypothetical protein